MATFGILEENVQTVAHLAPEASGYLSVKSLAARYGISKSTLYELIKSDPTFPYRNVGLRKRFLVDSSRFEVWLNDRTAREQDARFGLPTAHGLLEKHRK